MSAAAEHGHGHHPPYLAHHFHDMDQQSSSNKMGMWLFLVQEILFFAGLFMAYTCMRYLYPDTWLAGCWQVTPSQRSKVLPICLLVTSGPLYGFSSVLLTGGWL